MIRLVALAVAASSALLFPAGVSGHGVAPMPTSGLDVLLAWSIEAHVVLPLLVAALLYRSAVRHVNARHPLNPVPRFRSWLWYLGLLVLFVALASPIATYDATFFWVHMVQHLLLTLVAAPLLALGAPITLLLRVSSAHVRRRIVLPVLHSRVMRAISFPVVTWVVFAAVMWASHFSALFDAALENELVHIAEHAIFLGAALLFWWPVVGADPSPWRLPHAARVAYVFLGMPQSSFLGLAIFSAPNVLYPHYGSQMRAWIPTPLADQQLAGGIMWVGGDLAFLTAMILTVWVWLKAEEAEGRRVDARLDRDAAAAARRLTSRSAAAARPAATATDTATDERPMGIGPGSRG